MKKVKLLISGVLVLALMLIPTMSVFAEAPLSEGADPQYVSFSGTVKSIDLRVNADGTEMDGSKFVLLENEEGGLMNFVVSDNTYVVGSDLKEGEKATGYYLGNRPAIMIYPPQQPAEVMVVGEMDGQTVKVDAFDNDLVSSDNALKIISTEKTEIVDKNGVKFTGELAGKNLVVIYDVSTRSIPAQTTPVKVIVLAEKMDDDSSADVSVMDIVVNGEKIEAPKAYDKDGVTMVPVRAIAEKLGFEVGWDNASKSVTVGKVITFKIGTDSYNYAKMAPIELGTAAELKDGHTYVPLSFFKEVAQQNNGYVFEGQIVIDNAEEVK